MMGKKKMRYPRDEALYNLIQENEFFIFLGYLPSAVRHVAGEDTLWHGEGRPPKQLYDMLVCLAIKEYFGLSLRRTMGIIRFLRYSGHIDVNIPCFKTLNNYMNNGEIKPYLDALIKITSDPLRTVEHFFATDSTGVSTCCFSSWFCIRTRKKTKRRDHIMTHLTIGTMLNGACAVDVRTKRGEDNVIFRKHVADIGKDFNVEEWSGDSTYLSRENCNAVADIRAEPWFRLKNNITAKAKGSISWRKMVRGFREEPEIANPKYHRRSNAESTFSAKNRKFGSHVRSKYPTSQCTEETLKWVDYNFTVLARAKFECGITPSFAA